MVAKNIFRRRERIADLRRRIAGPQDAYERCRVYPCTNRTTADGRKGLNRLYCRKHVEFYRRHGSYVKRSYSVAELRPYRTEALRWLKEHREHRAVQEAAYAIDRLYRSAGPHLEAFRLMGKSPAERARATWAQIRERKIDPLRVIAAWLVVDRRLDDDPQADRHEEYRHVQVAKLVHRLAGGTHKRWEQEFANGRRKVTELHKHPNSRGRVLREIGAAVHKACSDLRDIYATKGT
jgi:hypothetical protein